MLYVFISGEYLDTMQVHVMMLMTWSALISQICYFFVFKGIPG